MVTTISPTGAAELRASRESTSSAGAGPLDLHEGIGTDWAGGCPRWPPALRLESTLGKLVPGRCKSTNLCDYCAKLGAVENAEVLAQDAMTNQPPALWSVLTTRSTTASMAAYKVARMSVTRAVRRRWPAAQRATLVEFTTGMGTRAEGARRPHWNDLWKGVPAEDADEFQAVLAGEWCGHVDAKPAGQYVGQVAETGGLMRYLALHFQKESQQPPHGWRSHRFTTSRGYLATPMVDARQAARQALRFRREMWKARVEGIDELLGPDPVEFDEYVQRCCYEAGELAWSLVRLQELPTSFGPDDLPTTWQTVVVPVGR